MQQLLHNSAGPFILRNMYVIVLYKLLHTLSPQTTILLKTYLISLFRAADIDPSLIYTLVSLKHRIQYSTLPHTVTYFNVKLSYQPLASLGTNSLPPLSSAPQQARIT